MTGKTVTRADLVEALAKRANMQRADANRLLTRMLEMMQDALVEGETVKLSSFGSFLVRAKGERLGRNPKTGVEASISPRRVIVFKASHVLKARVNGNAVDPDDED